MMDLVQKLDEKLQIRLRMDLKYFNEPDTISDFMNFLDYSIEKNSPLAMRCFKFIEMVQCDLFFPYIIDLCEKLSKTIHIEYALHSLTVFPQDECLIKEYIPK